MEIDLDEAQAQLFGLGELAWSGQEIVITRKGKPYLLLVAHCGDGPAGPEVEMPEGITGSQSSSSR